MFSLVQASSRSGGKRGSSYRKTGMGSGECSFHLAASIGTQICCVAQEFSGNVLCVVGFFLCKFCKSKLGLL